MEQPLSISPIATSYAAFAGVLFGFAFTGLLIYVTRGSRTGRSANAADVLITRKGELLRFSPIRASQVATSGFFAMAALGVTAFLYANLSGAGSPAGNSGQASLGPGTEHLAHLAHLKHAAVQATQAETELLVYGIALGLSVLALFHFTALMLFEWPLTRPAAKWAFWAGMIGGSVTIIRFLDSSAQIAGQAACEVGTCELRVPHSTWVGLVWLLLVAAGLTLITLFRVLEASKLRGFLKWFAHRPALAPGVSFGISVWVATLVSMYIKSPVAEPNRWAIAVSLVMGNFLILFFATASGCVIYPRVHGTKLSMETTEPETMGILQWLRARNRRNGHRHNVCLTYSSGSLTPVDDRGNLIWKIPDKPVGQRREFKSSLSAWNYGKKWCLDGDLFLVCGNEQADRVIGHEVRVTLQLGTEPKAPVISRTVLAGADKVHLEDSGVCGAGNSVQVTIERIDAKPDKVLLCWLNAAGTVVPSATEDALD